MSGYGGWRKILPPPSQSKTSSYACDTSLAVLAQGSGRQAQFWAPALANPTALGKSLLCASVSSPEHCNNSTYEIIVRIKYLGKCLAKNKYSINH